MVRKNEQIKYGNHIIFPYTNEVITKNKRIKLSPKEMGVLLLLLQNLDHTVERTEFLEKVWNNEVGNNQGLTQAISRLRSIFSNNELEVIRTIPKKGYLMIKPNEPRQKTVYINVWKRLKSNSVVIIVILTLIIGLFYFFQRGNIKIRIRKVRYESFNPSPPAGFRIRSRNAGES